MAKEKIVKTKPHKVHKASVKIVNKATGSKHHFEVEIEGKCGKHR